MRPSEQAVVDQIAAAIRDELDRIGLTRDNHTVLATVTAITGALVQAAPAVPGDWRHGVLLAGLGVADAIDPCR